MFKFLFRRKQLNKPREKIKYILPQRVIWDTEKILKEYGQKLPSNEGLVFWGGVKKKKIFTVTSVIAPKTMSNRGRVEVDNQSSFEVVNELCTENIKLIAQVHSHPSSWVDHSDGDNEMTAFKRSGLISIVVPTYCKNGMLPLSNCGVHLYQDNGFIRLSRKYVVKHFKTVNHNNSKLVDLR